MDPFVTTLHMASGVATLESPAQVLRRYLSDLRPIFQDQAAAAEILATEGDRLIYEVHVAPIPEEEGQVLYCTTTIYPGRIGAEFHMTKGHFHSKRDRGEVYLGLSGEGYLLLQHEDGRTAALKMEAGTVAYVPPYWAHRTVNTASEPFVFFAAWPGDAGHDYATIEEKGFAKQVLYRDGGIAFVDTPRYSEAP